MGQQVFQVLTPPQFELFMVYTGTTLCQFSLYLLLTTILAHSVRRFSSKSRLHRSFAIAPRLHSIAPFSSSSSISSQGLSSGFEREELLYKLSKDGNHISIMPRKSEGTMDEAAAAGGSNLFINNKKKAQEKTDSATTIGPGMDVEGLDRASFTQVLPLMCIRIPAKYCTAYLKQFKDMLYVRPRMKRIFSVNNTAADGSGSGFTSQELKTDKTTEKTEKNDKRSENRYLVLAESCKRDNVHEWMPERGELAKFIAENGPGYVNEELV